MILPIKKIDANAILPTKGSSDSAGFDLYALLNEDLSIEPGQTILVHTGLTMAIPSGYAGFIFARSGLATKEGLAPANKVGVVDADYRGEVMVSIHNHSQEVRRIQPGQRVAQMVILPIPEVELMEVDELEETNRGEGGFGSTGKQ